MDQSYYKIPEFIHEAVKKALDDGFAGIPPARGLMDLREAIATKLNAENDIEADPETEIMVVADSTPVVVGTCSYLIEAGDEVIVVDPGFNYGTHIQFFGGIPVRVPAYESNRFKVDPEDIQSSITHKTKFIIINTPANPTGTVLDRTELKEIVKIAREQNLWILSDESYEHIVYDGKKHISIGSFNGVKDRTISVYSLSTSYAMAGWDLGYVVAPKAVIDEMEKLGEHMGTLVSAVVQRVALVAMTSHRYWCQSMMKKYQNQRTIIQKGLNSIEDVSCQLSEGTFYAFPNFTKLGLTSWNLAKYLVREHKVALVPGSIFGTKGEGFLRLSYAVDPAKLKEAIARIKTGVGQLLNH